MNKLIIMAAINMTRYIFATEEQMHNEINKQGLLTYACDNLKDTIEFIYKYSNIIYVYMFIAYAFYLFKKINTFRDLIMFTIASIIISTFFMICTSFIIC